MPVYMLVEARTKDPLQYNQYIEKVAGLVAQHGGRYLVRGGKIVPLSDEWKPERIIILEFPSEANIRAWLESAEYGTLAPLREAGADARAVILEGYDAT